MPQPIKTAILISGRGSNMVSLLEAAKKPNYPANYALVIANKLDAGGLTRAAEFGVKTHVVEHKNYPTREAFEAELHQVLKAHGIELVVLAGFMRVLTPWFISRWAGRLINIHPALLPEFPGLHTHQRAIEAGVKEHGCTVHFVDEGVDTGQIIMQARVPVLTGDDEPTLAARVLEAEHRLFPTAVQHVCEQMQQSQASAIHPQALN